MLAKLTKQQIAALELNPCPCGSVDIVVIEDQLTTHKKKCYWVECNTCYAVGNIATSVDAAIHKWIKEVTC